MGRLAKAERVRVILPDMTTHTTTLIDPRQESILLDKYGLTYTEQDVALSDIDYEHSLHLNGRMETRANTDKITEYGLKKLDGETFPYVVLAYDNYRKKYLIWSGVHRTGADIEIKATSTKAFVVQVSPPGNPEIETKLKAFAAESNVRHGFATSTAERLHAACDEHALGIDINEIASRFALSPEEILKGVKERKLNFDLRQCGLRPELITRSSDKEAILRAPDEPTMRDVAALIIRHTTREKGEKAKVALTQNDVTSLVAALRKEKSPVERTKLLDAADATAKAGRPKRKGKDANNKDPRTSPTFVWRGCVTRLTREFDERELVKHYSTGDALDALMTDVKAVRGVLDAVERSVERQR